MNMCCQLACGLEHLCKLGITHNDVATRNCVISSQLLVKISVLSLCREGFEKWVATRITSFESNDCAYPNSCLVSFFLMQYFVDNFYLVFENLLFYPIENYWQLKIDSLYTVHHLFDSFCKNRCLFTLI